MTFRSLKSVMLVALAAELGVAVACSGSGSAKGPKTDSSAGAVASAPAGVAASDTLGPKLPANHAGRIPVLEYHVIGRDKNSLYTRTVASFKADLEDVYRRGYRP